LVPVWKGRLPEHVQRIDCPTNAFLAERANANQRSADFEFVHTIQQELQAGSAAGSRRRPRIRRAASGCHVRTEFSWKGKCSAWPRLAWWD